MKKTYLNKIIFLVLLFLATPKPNLHCMHNENQKQTCKQKAEEWFNEHNSLFCKEAPAYLIEKFQETPKEEIRKKAQDLNTLIKGCLDLDHSKTPQIEQWQTNLESLTKEQIEIETKDKIKNFIHEIKSGITTYYFSYFNNLFYKENQRFTNNTITKDERSVIIHYYKTTVVRGLQTNPTATTRKIREWRKHFRLRPELKFFLKLTAEPIQMYWLNFFNKLFDVNNKTALIKLLENIKPRQFEKLITSLEVTILIDFEEARVQVAPMIEKWKNRLVSLRLDPESEQTMGKLKRLSGTIVRLTDEN